ncbi:hypothetical protein [Ammoniphilus oxalaticus]|uniref:hypothetical protein n=1 Tax=Ammoniphilus oxalaticus TaxID=66863 RepID=UPI0014761218|nr:hypothetical protein [Ammoniphilus oxalaticus]
MIEFILFIIVVQLALILSKIDKLVSGKSNVSMSKWSWRIDRRPPRKDEYH